MLRSIRGGKTVASEIRDVADIGLSWAMLGE
jgi:hypothetical protein